MTVPLGMTAIFMTTTPAWGETTLRVTPLMDFQALSLGGIIVA
jgi:hypothetical protein